MKKDQLLGVPVGGIPLEMEKLERE